MGFEGEGSLLGWEGESESGHSACRGHRASEEGVVDQEKNGYRERKRSGCDTLYLVYLWSMKVIVLLPRIVGKTKVCYVGSRFHHHSCGFW